MTTFKKGDYFYTKNKELGYIEYINDCYVGTTIQWPFGGSMTSSYPLDSFTKIFDIIPSIIVELECVEEENLSWLRTIIGEKYKFTIPECFKESYAATSKTFKLITDI